MYTYSRARARRSPFGKTFLSFSPHPDPEVLILIPPKRHHQPLLISRALADRSDESEARGARLDGESELVAQGVLACVGREADLVEAGVRAGQVGRVLGGQDVDPKGRREASKALCWQPPCAARETQHLGFWEFRVFGFWFDCGEKE